MQLSLFGVVHTDRLSIVQSELEDQVRESNAEAIFIEAPERRLSLLEWVVEFIQRPLVVLGFLIYSVQTLPLYAILARRVMPTELRAVQNVQVDQDLDVYHVDPHVDTIFRYGGYPGILLNWILLLATFIFFAPTHVISTTIIIVFGYIVIKGTQRWSERAAAIISLPVFIFYILFVASQFLVGSYFLLIPLFASVVATRMSINRRNSMMLRRVNAIAGSVNYDQAILITGRSHISDLRKKIEAARELSLRSIWIRHPFRQGRP